MNLLVIASRIAGKTLLLMKDMGYDPAKLVYNATQKLVKNGKKWPEANTEVNQAILRAWEKAGLQDPEIQNGLDDDPRSYIHELEHKAMDPDFDLTSSSSGKFKAPSKSHSLVESLMEEALSWGFSGTGKSEVIGVVNSNAADYVLKGQKTVADVIKNIANAPISNPARRKIRDSAVHILKTDFKNEMNRPISDNITKNIAQIIDIGIYHNYGYAISYRFLDVVSDQFDEWKDILETEHEESWKRFNLNLKNEINKLIPDIQSKSYDSGIEEDKIDD